MERRFHHLKGPLAVAPMFLKNPERIAELPCILVRWLMVLALMERRVRAELNGEPLDGLYPEHRPSVAPKGPALMESSSGWCIVIIVQAEAIQRQLVQPTPAQYQILKLISVHSIQLRTFKRSCGTRVYSRGGVR